MFRNNKLCNHFNLQKTQNISSTPNVSSSQQGRNVGPECLRIIYAVLRSTSLFFFYLREAENLANCKTESYSAALILLAWPPAVVIRMCDRGRDNLITGLGTSSSCVLLLPQCTCKGKENTWRFSPAPQHPSFLGRPCRAQWVPEIWV